MNKWLAALHEYFVDRRPFVVATVSAYHGSSPDTPGVALLHSDAKSQQFINSDQRYLKMRDTASMLLSRPTTLHTEKLTLGEVAGTNNGYCDVVYEYFDGIHYPGWLTELRKLSQKGLSCTLLREFDNNNQVIRTQVLHNAIDEKTSVMHVGNRMDCSALENATSLQLLRTVRADTIAITLVGNHPVIDEIQNQSSNLPIKINRVDNTAEYSVEDNIVIIMTTDHELDYQCCETTLKQLTGEDAFIGCIGSEKKAEIFISRLKQNGIDENQLKQFHMPVGVKKISGKQNSVVAASIVAQILMHHQW